MVRPHLEAASWERLKEVEAENTLELPKCILLVEDTVDETGRLQPTNSGVQVGE